MTQTIRLLLFSEGGAFLLASLSHAGLLVRGYEHREARIAETVIGIVLLAGVALTWALPQSVRAVALGAQAFALLGTLVGIFTIVIGIGPRTTIDVVYHIAIVIVLVYGLLVAGRARAL